MSCDPRCDSSRGQSRLPAVLLKWSLFRRERRHDGMRILTSSMAVMVNIIAPLLCWLLSWRCIFKATVKAIQGRGFYHFGWEDGRNCGSPFHAVMLSAIAIDCIINLQYRNFSVLLSRMDLFRFTSESTPLAHTHQLINYWEYTGLSTRSSIRTFL